MLTVTKDACDHRRAAEVMVNTMRGVIASVVLWLGNCRVAPQQPFSAHSSR